MSIYFLLSFAVCSLAYGEEIPQSANDIATLASMSEIILQLVDRVNHLEEDNGIQQQKIEEMEATIMGQTAVISNLERKLEEQVKESETELHGDISFDKVTGQIQGHLPSYNSTEFMHQAPNRGTPEIAFSVVAEKSNEHLGIKQKLIFDIVDVDTVNAFNIYSGIFTVPVSGVYVISSSVLSGMSREVWCDITINGFPKAKMYGRGTDHRFDQGSQTILLHLMEGDLVAVENEMPDDTVHGGLYTSFSGYLLYED